VVGIKPKGVSVVIAYLLKKSHLNCKNTLINTRKSRNSTNIHTLRETLVGLSILFNIERGV